MVVEELTQRRYVITNKELELALLLCLPCKIISGRLGLADAITRKRVARLLAKFEVENRTSLIVKLLKLDLIGIDQLVYREFT